MQLITNLVDNAIQASKQGQVRILVDWEPNLSSIPLDQLEQMPKIVYAQEHEINLAGYSTVDALCGKGSDIFELSMWSEIENQNQSIIVS